MAIFINFMTPHAQLKAAMRVKILMSTLLYTARDVEKNPGPTDPWLSKERSTPASTAMDTTDLTTTTTRDSGIAASIKTLIRAQTDMQQTM